MHGVDRLLEERQKRKLFKKFKTLKIEKEGVFRGENACIRVHAFGKRPSPQKKKLEKKQMGTIWDKSLQE